MWAFHPLALTPGPANAGASLTPSSQPDTFVHMAGLSQTTCPLTPAAFLGSQDVATLGAGGVQLGPKPQWGSSALQGWVPAQEKPGAGGRRLSLPWKGLILAEFS